MESTAIILIAIALLLLVIVVALLALLVLKLLKQTAGPTTPLDESQRKETPSTQLDISRSEFHPGILNRLNELEKLKPKRSDLFCPNHTEEPGEVPCAICDLIFCRACIKPFKTLHFCKEHIPLIMRHEWDEVLTLKTSTSDPEQGVRLYDIKKDIFKADGIPTYVETHYKINVDQDYIETYLVLFAMRDEVEVVREKFQGLNLT